MKTDYEKEIRALMETRKNLEKDLYNVELAIRKLKVKHLMEDYELEGGELVEVNGKRYLIVSFDTMWQENRDWYSVWLKAYPIKKDGTPSKKVEIIYVDKERVKRV